MTSCGFVVHRRCWELFQSEGPCPAGSVTPSRSCQVGVKSSKTQLVLVGELPFSAETCMHFSDQREHALACGSYDEVPTSSGGQGT